MKKNIAIIVACVLFISFSGKISAQENPHQFSFGYGLATTSDILDAFESGLTSVLTLGIAKTENSTATGAFCFSYNYAVSKVVHIGGAVTYENISEDWTLSDSTEGKVNRDFFTLAAECKFSYVNAESFQLYSGIGLGATLDYDEFTPATGAATKDNQTIFNFQLNLLGLRFGNTFGGFAELGFGYKGIVNVGLSLRM